MYHYTILAVVAASLAGVYYAISFIILQRELAVKAKEIGASDYVPQPRVGFLGIPRLQRTANADKAQRFTDYLAEVQDDVSDQEGRVVDTHRFRILFWTMRFTSDPRNIQAMLSTQFNDFDLGPQRRAVLLPAIGDGIFVQDGKAWEHSRALLRPNFIRDQISDLDLEERHIQNLFKILSRTVQEDGWTTEVDIQNLFFQFTLDSASEFLFGESVESLLIEAEYDNNRVGDNTQIQRQRDFARCISEVQGHASIRFRIAPVCWLWNPKSFRDSVKVVNEFVAPYVSLALQKASREKSSDHPSSERYIFLEELATRTQDPKELQAQLLSVLAAGRDTTASLLSWLFHELLRHPDVYEKLRNTILQHFGTYEEPKNITFATLKDCQYLRHCLDEALRLWPVAPINIRQANKVTSLPFGGGPDGNSPIVLRPGDAVSYSVYVLHRRKDIWGPDADEYNPERWSHRKPGWSFLPFNGGPRICLGQQFALTETAYVIVRMLQKFDRIDTNPDNLKLDYVKLASGKVKGYVRNQLGLTACPARPVKLRMHVAK